MGSGLLGRGLISAKPKADGGPFDEGQIVCRELVIPRRNPSALFDLVEEPLNKIARATEVRAEADGVPAIAFGRDVCPCTLIVNKRPDPVGLMATVGKHHRLRAQSGQEYWAKPIVVSLAGRRDQGATASHWRPPQRAPCWSIRRATDPCVDLCSRQNRLRADEPAQRVYRSLALP